MAALKTYLLISGLESPAPVSDSPLVEKYGFEHRETREPGPEQRASVTFVVERSLEETVDLEAPLRKLSTTLPDATIIVCEVEERFDQVERFHMQVYRDGKKGGSVEHGYIFNVGFD